MQRAGVRNELVDACSKWGKHKNWGCELVNMHVCTWNQESIGWLAFWCVLQWKWWNWCSRGAADLTWLMIHIQKHLVVPLLLHPSLARSLNPLLLKIKGGSGHIFKSFCVSKIDKLLIIYPLCINRNESLWKLCLLFLFQDTCSVVLRLYCVGFDVLHVMLVLYAMLEFCCSHNKSKQKSGTILAFGVGLIHVHHVYYFIIRI